MSYLQLEKIYKSYVEGTNVLDGLDMTVEEGEIVVVLGKSGCGKTTLLKIISGLEKQTSGNITVDGESIDDIKPNLRPVSMMFQKPLLFGNMTVEENISFGKRIKGEKKEIINADVERLVQLVGLEGLEKRKPKQLSGGQEQRVSLARALMVNPKVLLLDEPLSALDANLRLEMREKIVDVHKETGTTMIMVTHDQSEAAAMADKIAFMDCGKILQFAPPKEFYSNPVNSRVASFFGWKNCLDCTVSGENVRSAIGEFNVKDFEGNGEFKLLIRPDAAEISADGVICPVVSASFNGLDSTYTVDYNGFPLRIRLDGTYGFNVGERIGLSLNTDKMAVVKE